MRISFGNEENVWLLSLVAFPSSLSSSYTRTFVDGRVTPGSGNAIQGVLCNDTDARNFRARQFDDNATPNESSMRAVSGFLTRTVSLFKTHQSNLISCSSSAIPF